MFNHEVWNDTDEDRYLLPHPDQAPLPGGLANWIQNLFLLGARHSRFAQDIRMHIDRAGE
jgi:beta-hydroxylase